MIKTRPGTQLCLSKQPNHGPDPKGKPKDTQSDLTKGKQCPVFPALTKIREFRHCPRVVGRRKLLISFGFGSWALTTATPSILENDPQIQRCSPSGQRGQQVHRWADTGRRAPTLCCQREGSKQTLPTSPGPPLQGPISPGSGLRVSPTTQGPRRCLRTLLRPRHRQPVLHPAPGSEGHPQEARAGNFHRAAWLALPGSSTPVPGHSG